MEFCVFSELLGDGCDNKKAIALLMKYQNF